MSHIQASSHNLLNQAPTTATRYLRAAIESIDREFERDYAKNHPELVSAYMKVAASDFNTANQAKAHAEAIEALAESVDKLADKLESFFPAG
jgi:hemoglobin-like flavoprotein